MNIKTMNILAGVLFALAGVVTLLEGIFNTRASNICIGIALVIVGALYFVQRKKLL
ncbi:MAG: hypothetical protein NC433_06960 [Clostridiales bacterium]|nr:hypothetical protein [Clostridiales bacterium]